MSAEKPRFHRFEENGRQFLADPGGIWEIEPVGRRFLRSSEIPGRQILLLLAQIEALEAERNRLRAEALPVAFADCEALVSAMLQGMADHLEAQAKGLDEKDPRYARAWNRSDVLRQAALAVSLGQHRSAEVNERAIVAAHREAAGFNSSKAGGEARSRALSPERRREIAALGGRARKRCSCPLNCPYCGRRRSRDTVGHYCKTHNCQYQHGYTGCELAIKKND